MPGALSSEPRRSGCGVDHCKAWLDDRTLKASYF